MHSSSGGRMGKKFEHAKLIKWSQYDDWYSHLTHEYTELGGILDHRQPFYKI